MPDIGELVHEAARRPERRAFRPSGQRHGAAGRPRLEGGGVALALAQRYRARITVHELSGHELLRVLRTPWAADQLGGADGGAVVVRDIASIVAEDALVDVVRTVPCVVVGVGAASPDAPQTLELFDVVVDDGGIDLAAVLAAVQAHPLAATALALLLRGSEQRSPREGLVLESAVYSTLQAGPEFAAWRASRPVKARPSETTPTVRTVRYGEWVTVTLSRPHVRNALDARMRDELYDALAAVAADPSVAAIELTGDGATFCSGGDLDEFGTHPDPASAHLVRLTRSVAASLHALADRTTARVHGDCRGSGVELPAFARRVVADAAATFALPEVSMGLVPGAGGTVSLPHRIGRHRTAWLALTGTAIDAATAHAWGLVDEMAAAP